MTPPPIEASLLLPVTSGVDQSSRWSLGGFRTHTVHRGNFLCKSFIRLASLSRNLRPSLSPSATPEVRVRALIFLLLSLLISSPVWHVQSDMERLSGSSGLNPAQDSFLSQIQQAVLLCSASNKWFKKNTSSFLVVYICLIDSRTEIVAAPT